MSEKNELLNKLHRLEQEHRDLDEVISHTAKRALEQAGIEIKEMDRWTGPRD